MDWNYISGFFDADGSITLTKHGKERTKSPQLSFHNNELKILEEIKNFILSELQVKGFISKKKKQKEHHGQQYDLKYQDFYKCGKIMKKINSLHDKKNHRFEVIEKLKVVTPRNGKYNEELMTKKSILEEEFFI